MGSGDPAAPAPLVLVGPTAVGKTAVALALARRRPGTEIVCVDAMAVYRGMDVGTAKPGPAERAGVPHHLLDLADPSEDFSVADFQAAGRAVLVDLAARGVEPLVVAGTGLYLRALVDELTLPGRWPEVRAGLDADPDTAGLHRRLAALDPVAASRMDPANRRRVVRALEVTLGSGRPFSSFGPGLETYPAVPWVQVGLRRPREVLDQRIAERYQAQLAAGFLDEVRGLLAGPAPWSRTASQALGYRELAAAVRGECSLDEAVEEAVVRTRRFARRQERWFRRDPRIAWVDAGDEDDPEVLADRVLATAAGATGRGVAAALPGPSPEAGPDPGGA